MSALPERRQTATQTAFKVLVSATGRRTTPSDRPPSQEAAVADGDGSLTRLPEDLILRIGEELVSRHPPAAAALAATSKGLQTVLGKSEVIEREQRAPIFMHAYITATTDPVERLDRINRHEDLCAPGLLERTSLEAIDHAAPEDLRTVYEQCASAFPFLDASGRRRVFNKAASARGVMKIHALEPIVKSSQAGFLLLHEALPELLPTLRSERSKFALAQLLVSNRSFTARRALRAARTIQRAMKPGTLRKLLESECDLVAGDAGLRRAERSDPPSVGEQHRPQAELTHFINRVRDLSRFSDQRIAEISRKALAHQELFLATATELCAQVHLLPAEQVQDLCTRLHELGERTASDARWRYGEAIHALGENLRTHGPVARPIADAIFRIFLVTALPYRRWDAVMMLAPALENLERSYQDRVAELVRTEPSPAIAQAMLSTLLTHAVVGHPQFSNALVDAVQGLPERSDRLGLYANISPDYALSRAQLESLWRDVQPMHTPVEIDAAIGLAPHFTASPEDSQVLIQLAQRLYHLLETTPNDDSSVHFRVHDTALRFLNGMLPQAAFVQPEVRQAMYMLGTHLVAGQRHDFLAAYARHSDLLATHDYAELARSVFAPGDGIESGWARSLADGAHRLSITQWQAMRFAQ